MGGIKVNIKNDSNDKVSYNIINKARQDKTIENMKKFKIGLENFYNVLFD